MYKVLYNKKINTNSYELLVEAPLVVEKCIPGQFAIIMPKEDSERIPLTIYDTDVEKGLVYFIYQVVGASTEELSTIQDEVFSVVGPLGNGNEICSNPEAFKGKKICYVGGGVGIAPVYPQVKFLKEHGFDIDVVYGARSADLFLIRDKIEAVAHKVRYATDDGSFGTKGFVTDVLGKNVDDYDIVVAIGPMVMMRSVVNLTKEHNVRTIISMNPLMVDGSGMCGACRCEVDGKPKFACIHGPEFDGFQVNFDLAMKRMSIYREEEKEKWEMMKKKLAEGGESHE